VSLSVAVAVGAVACTDSNGPGGDVAFVGISGLPASNQFHVGEWIFLSATTYDRDHHLITNVPITWVSSDTSVANVAPWANGVQVLGRSPGPVTITAISQGQSAGANLTVLIVPVAGVRVTPDAAASYAGMRTQLTGTPYDSLGRDLAGRRVTWATSDAAKATVDTTGLVTAVGGGSATITATCEGKSASANLSILARPTADWSAVTGEWSTYQGNADHTGYVPATLDPVIFTRAWETAVVPSVALNPVTVGAGKVYVSTNAYFGVQQLHALDAVTGGKLWMKSFGSIHSVDPPAYADGSVYLATGGHDDSYIWAFDAVAGTERFHTAYDNQWSRWYAPVIIGQTLYMAGGYYGGMYAFSTVDGTERWFLGLNQYDEFTPAVQDTLVYAYTGSYNPQLTVANATTGALAYSIPDSAFSWNGWSMGLAPVLGSSNNLLAAQSGSGRLLSFDLTNRRIGWTIPGTFAGQVTLANGVIFVRNNQGLQARQETDGALLWSWRPPQGLLQGTMIATRNLLFVSTSTTTYAVDLGAHLQAWSYPAGGELALSKDGLLLIAQSNGSLTAIDVR